MQGMKQFTLLQMLIEISLFATFLGLWRVAAIGSLPYGVVAGVLLPAALVGVAGAFIGGLHKQYWLGALIGTSIVLFVSAVRLLGLAFRNSHY